MVGQVEKSRRRTAALIGAAVILSVEGCFSPPPPQHLFQSSSITSHLVSHTVERGDTIYHIAHLYGVTPQRLMAANGLTNPRQLEVGQRLIIPLRRETAASASLSPWPLARADRQFAWPITDGVVSSPFGIRNGVMHDGVDIVAHAGTPIRAADNGTVIFSGHLHGYGNAVILRHSGGYVTIYGHNKRNLVRYGAAVTRGQEIAELGSTGRATGPNLHFEVRFQGQPQNPLAYFPPPLSTNGIDFARNGTGVVHAELLPK